MPAIIGIIINAILGPGLDLIKHYMDGKITLEQLRTQLGVVALQEQSKIEQAVDDMVKTTYPAFVEAIKSSRLVRIAYFYTVITQASVLVFYQAGVPLLVWFRGGTFPSPGDQLLQWNIGLLVLLVGGGTAMFARPAQPKVRP